MSHVLARLIPGRRVVSLVSGGVAAAAVGIVVAVVASCGSTRHERHETHLPSSFAASRFAVGGVGIDFSYGSSSLRFYDLYEALGDPGTERHISDDCGLFSCMCVATWPTIGLRIVNVYSLHDEGCSRDNYVDLLILDDRRWHTPAGLHVGDTTVRLRRLYPQAKARVDERIPDPKARRWDLEVGPPQRVLSEGKWITFLPIWTVAFTSASHVRYLAVATNGAAAVFPWSWSDLWEQDAAPTIRLGQV